MERLDHQQVAITKGSIDAAESAGTLAQYIEHVVKSALVGVKGEQALARRIELCNRLIQLLTDEIGDPSFQQYRIHSDAEFLLALLEKRDSIPNITHNSNDTTSIRPVTSIAQSSLFTGAPHEPSMVSELKKEILTSDRIDLLVSFIKWSGLRLLMNELRSLPHTDMRISYDTHRTRLHAKAYVFHRNTGFSTAYVGSSNLSNAALSTGMERQSNSQRSA